MCLLSPALWSNQEKIEITKINTLKLIMVQSNATSSASAGAGTQPPMKTRTVMSNPTINPAFNIFPPYLVGPD